MKIKEYENGKFQIWTDDESMVLRPSTVEWLGSHQWKHDFMFIDGLESARYYIRAARNKESGMKLKRTFDGE